VRAEVTEFDLRRPEFQDPKLKPEHFEFDADGEVVRKDRFETGMRRVHGILIEQGLASSRDKWNVDSVLSKLKGTFSEAQRLKLLIKIIHYVPEEAEYFHFENMAYVKNVDKEHLQQAIEEPEESHLINFEFWQILNEESKGWEDSSAWLAYINVLVSMGDIRKEISDLVGLGVSA